MAARGRRSPLLLADRDGRDPDAARARSDGRCERAGLPPPGPPFRGRARLLGDGQLRRAPPRQRAHARLPAHRRATSIRSPCRSSAPTRAVMAEAARMVADAGADIVDINFGCPVRKVTKTGAGATLLEDPDRASRIVEAVADAVDLPVSVKMRRGLENGSRTCLELGPRLVDAGAASLTLHPRSARQMYTGEADHSLTAELVELVDVPGDRLRRHHLARPRPGACSRRRAARPSWSAAPRRATPGRCAPDRRRRRAGADVARRWSPS